MEKLLKILTDLHPDVDFVNEKALIDDNIIDSFDFMTTIGEICNEFDIEMPADKLVPENFNTVEAMYALIQSLED
ncbi:MAG: acyl carrier protein [Oscillospiraceae bacterium]|nr:acyl carrier protein [Oscillospiraceae bacterium]